MRVEPDLVAIRIEDLEGPIPPPLQCQRVADGDIALLQTVVERLDGVYLEIDLDGLLTSRGGMSPGARMNMIRASPITTVQKSNCPSLPTIPITCVNPSVSTTARTGVRPHGRVTGGASFPGMGTKGISHVSPAPSCPQWTRLRQGALDTPGHPLAKGPVTRCQQRGHLARRCIFAFLVRKEDGEWQRRSRIRYRAGR